MGGFVLVGGWPAAGKTTLARPLACELKFAYLSKDDVKEALMDTLGAPSTVEESRDLGRAAVAARSETIGISMTSGLRGSSGTARSLLSESAQWSR